MRKVLLAFPPNIIYDWEGQNFTIYMLPLGIGYLAAVLRKRCEVTVLDALAEGHSCRRSVADGSYASYGLPIKKIRERIAAEKPDMVGLSAIYSAQIPTSIEIARAAKQISPDTVVVAGGSHASFRPQDLLQSGVVDYVVEGEGEQTLAELVAAIDRGCDVGDVRGLYFLRDGGTAYTGERPLIEDLDTLPYPARDLFPMEFYFRINRPWLGMWWGGARSRRNALITTTRGCPFRCNFCASARHWRYRYRKRNIESVISEMIHMKEKFGIEEVQFADDSLLLDRARSVRLFRAMIEARLGLAWSTPNGVSVESLDEELLKLMAESGCYELTFAVESGCQEVLDSIIHKRLRLERVKPLVKAAKSLGIRTAAYFIIGFPGETTSQMRQTMAFALECKFDLPILFAATPLLGSALHEQLVEDGQLGAGFDLTLNDYCLHRFETPSARSAEVNSLLKKFYSSAFPNYIGINPRLYGGIALRNALSSLFAAAGWKLGSLLSTIPIHPNRPE